jgi:putative intracellular protease/amidase
MIGETLDPVSLIADSARFNPAVQSTHDEAIVPMHTFQDDFDGDLLTVPGGVGTRARYPCLNSIVDYIKKAYPRTKHLLYVCIGAFSTNELVATTNKKAWGLVYPKWS